jgi:hypothetical protein
MHVLSIKKPLLSEAEASIPLKLTRTTNRVILCDKDGEALSRPLVAILLGVDARC